MRPSCARLDLPVLPTSIPTRLPSELLFALSRDGVNRVPAVIAEEGIGAARRLALDERVDQAFVGHDRSHRLRADTDMEAGFIAFLGYRCQPTICAYFGRDPPRSPPLLWRESGSKPILFVGIRGVAHAIACTDYRPADGRGTQTLRLVRPRNNLPATEDAQSSYDGPRYTTAAQAP